MMLPWQQLFSHLLQMLATALRRPEVEAVFICRRNVEDTRRIFSPSLRQMNQAEMVESKLLVKSVIFPSARLGRSYRVDFIDLAFSLNCFCKDATFFSFAMVVVPDLSAMISTRSYRDCCFQWHFFRGAPQSLHSSHRWSLPQWV